MAKPFGEHGDFGHGRQLFDESVVVPLVLWGGLAGKPGTDHTPVSLTQIHSTLLSAGGVASNVQTDLREAPSGGPVFSETNQDGVSLRAVWVEDRKTIWNRATNEMIGFDLSVDPGEQRAQTSDLLLQKGPGSACG